MINILTACWQVGYNWPINHKPCGLKASAETGVSWSWAGCISQPKRNVMKCEYSCLPPPRYSCCSAYTEKRKGLWHILGLGPVLLPTRRTEGNSPRPPSLCLSMVSDDQASQIKGQAASLKTARSTLYALPLLGAALSGAKQSTCLMLQIPLLIIWHHPSGIHLQRQRGFRHVSVGSQYRLLQVETICWQTPTLSAKHWLLSSDSRFFCWSRVLQTLCPWARDFRLLSHLKFFKLLIVYEEPVFGCVQQKGYSAWGMNETQLLRTFLGERGEGKRLAQNADSPLFIYFLGIQKISQLCCDRNPIHILTTLSLPSLKELTNLTAYNSFTEKARLTYPLNRFPRYVCTDSLTLFFAVTLILMWNNPWTMHTHFEWTQTMPQLRSDCSTAGSQVTHCSWLFASQESDRWKYIIRDFAAVAIVKFFTLLNNLLENSDLLWHLILFRSQLMTATSNLR